MADSTGVTEWLGYAGLIPFVAPAVLLLGDIGNAQLWQSIAGAYAFGIIAFLTGSWWGMALKPPTRTVLLLSNIFFLLALAGYLLAPELWPLASVLIFMTILFTEQNTALLPSFAGGYRKLRRNLSLIASGAMLVVYFAA